jgi:GH24 family phage-related lysozyme (muramidase)
MAKKISQKGLAFIQAHEGFVGKYYLDPVGVGTLGYGFTNNSAAVRRMLGEIKPGMTITKTKAKLVLEAVVNEEYGPAVNASLNNPNQHEFDMAASASFNVGARIFGWKWAKAFNEGDKKEAADLWRVTATTAKGNLDQRVTLPGLVRRRKEEAELLLNGIYTGVTGPTTFKETKKVVKADPELLEYQKKLIKLGYDTGAADGWMGPQTTAAVMAFQEDDPHLDNDGLLGRATKESIDRHGGTKVTTRNVSIGGAVGAGMSGLTWLGNQSNLITYVVIAVVLVIGGYLIIKYRKKLEAKVLGALA